MSRTNKRPAFGSIFLLNNISYLRTSLIVSPRVDISSLLSKPTQDILNSNFRIAKAGYFDSNFTLMMQALADDGQKSNAAVKEKFTRFYDLLEENAERHKLARVLQDDAESRQAICEEAVKMVVPSLQRFTQKSTGKGFSKSGYYFFLSVCLRSQFHLLVRSVEMYVLKCWRLGYTADEDFL